MRDATRTLLAFLVVLYSVFLASRAVAGGLLAFGLVPGDGPLALTAVPAIADAASAHPSIGRSGSAHRSLSRASAPECRDASSTGKPLFATGAPSGGPLNGKNSSPSLAFVVAGDT
jgi:hypothetical protein